jgi:Gpi18-like mannosyltransferase
LLNLTGKFRQLLTSEIGKVFIIGLSSRLLIFAVAFLTSIFYSSAKIVSSIPIINFFSQWDGAWYTQIALFGYPAGSNPLSGNWAFFPLYPFLMRIFGTPFFGLMSSTEAVLVAGFLISNVLFFVSLFLFYKVTKIIFGKNIFALISTVFFAFWPGALFYSTVYSESIFMLFALGAFYLLEKGKSGKSAVLGFFAALTRSNGFLILIPFVYNGLQTRKYRTAILQTIVIVLPYLLFNVYGYFSTGLFPVREIVYNHFWGASRLSLTQVTSYQIGYTGLFSVEAVLILLPFAWFLLTEKVLISDFVKGLVVERKDLKYWVFSIYILLMLLFYSDPQNLHRYSLPILPLYWVSALIFEKNKKIGIVLFIVSTVILVIGTILFTTGNNYL